MKHISKSLESILRDFFNDRITSLECTYGQLTLVVEASYYLEIASMLRNEPSLDFSIALDLAGVDYSTYGNGSCVSPRFAVVLHLLSIKHNFRLRLRVFAPDDNFPILPSLVGVWNGLNWFEREAFDLFGIIFDGHPDLRRILTDYGFIGHPFRKDFPISGHVEMRYDSEEKRIVYQPVTIEPREIVPRVVREQRYGNLKYQEMGMENEGCIF